MGSLSRLAKKAITREINRQFLNAGYMEKWTDKWTLSRGHTIQGVIISPVKLNWDNIYPRYILSQNWQPASYTHVDISRVPTKSL